MAQHPVSRRSLLLGAPTAAAAQFLLPSGARAQPSLPGQNTVFQQDAAGAVERSLLDRIGESVSVLDFIPEAEHAAILAGTSTYDSAAAIQAANDVGRGVYAPGKRYLLLSGVELTGPLTGDGAAITQFVAGAPMDYMFSVSRQHSDIERVKMTGRGLAKVGIRVRNANGFRLQLADIGGMKWDGVEFASVSNNSSSEISNCVFSAGGTSFSAGTAANGANGTAITFSGAPDLTTLGLRPNIDMVKVGTSPATTIVGVTARTINVSQAIAAAHRGAAYQILQGFPINIVSNGDNSAIRVKGVEMLQCKGAFIRDNALYGAHIEDCIFEGSQAYAVVVGYGTAGYSVIGHRNLNAYIEGCPDGAVLLESAVHPVISFAALGIDFDQTIRIPNSARVSAPHFSYGGIAAVGNTAALSDLTAANLSFGVRFDIQQRSNDLVLMLPPLTGEAITLASGSDMPIVVQLLDLGGRRVKFRSRDGFAVNGVAGTSGVSFATNYTRLECRFTGFSQWVVA
jgi:hypothetical protein